VRFVVLTSIVVTAATATALAQPDQLCQVDDRSLDSASSPVDNDQGRRPGTTPLAATPAEPPLVEPLLADPIPVVLDELQDAQITAVVIAFAPKTSPPAARWF
jgi:hypothetical protein